MNSMARGPRRASHGSVVAVIGSMVIVNLVYGLTLPLLSLILDAWHVSKTVIGLSILVQAGAGVLLSPVIPRLIVRVGSARMMQAATVVAALTLLSLGLFRDVQTWFPLRFLLGAAAAVLWSASEVVINELTSETFRGRVIGVYGSAGAAGFALGPLILIATGTDGLTPFAVTAGLIALAGLPLFRLRDRDDAETPDREPHAGLWAVFRLVPHILLLNLAYAAAIESFIAFFPLFGLDVGLGTTRSLALLTVFAIGGVVLQLPLGWLADHMDRGRLLLACLIMTLAGFLAFPWLVTGGVGGAIFVFALGGVEGMIYALGIILLGQTFRGARLATASVLYTAMWGVGMMLGPPLVGAGMDVFGDARMPFLIAAIYVVYLPVYFFGRHRASGRAGIMER